MPQITRFFWQCLSMYLGATAEAVAELIGQELCSALFRTALLQTSYCLGGPDYFPIKEQIAS
jgi:hypothetical protein